MDDHDPAGARPAERDVDYLGADGIPAVLPEDDFDADASMAQWVADLEAGRDRIPEEWECEDSGIALSLGDACDLDPALLAAMLGPEGLGGESLSVAFGQDGPADALRPGPVLAALAEQTASDLGALSDDQLTGVMQAGRRLEARGAYLQTLSVAEFARRRRAQYEDAKARRVPPGRRPGEFAAEELACELLVTVNWADARIERDLALTSRLPSTLAGLAAGVITADRADVIAAWTMSLTDADAAHADEILAAAAPGLRYEQLSRKAAALELKLNPEGVKARKETARQTSQRVELRREDSGNASLSGRELDTADALASKAYIDALAVRIRNHGHLDLPLGVIRARVMTELTQGRNPLDLIKPRPRPEPPADGPAPGPAAVRDPDDPGPQRPTDLDDSGPGWPDEDDPAGYGDGDGFGGPGGDGGPDDPGPGYGGPGGTPAWTDDEVDAVRYTEPDDPGPRRGPLRPGQSAPPPANLNLIIPIGTLLGWSTAPAQAGSFGLLDPDETRALAAAASQHPRTRWSATITDPVGRAIAHGRARGQHPWDPPEPPPPAPPPDHSAQLAKLMGALNILFDPVAQDTCDHTRAEDRYTPSRRLADAVRARTQTCDAPGCNAQAIHCDLDHTRPYPDGLTCQCNLGPKCRRHHRAKQAPGWHVEQPQPGVTRWTLPNGRMHTTTPTEYDN